MVDEALAPGRLPAGHRIYAVGDVHGCLEELLALHGRIAADLAARPVPQALLLHLGDYIDRGPDSARVVEHLAAGPAPGLPPTLNLMGNHEDMLLAALDGHRGAAELWLGNGGVAALQSWQVKPRTPPRDWAGLLPARHLDFLRGLALSHEAGGYFFAHAGIRPGVPLDRQVRQDLLWIREPFLRSDRDHGAVVVHGHTPEDHDPVVHGNRIGIDTGAVMGGRLTCAVLQEDRLGFLFA